MADEHHPPAKSGPPSPGTLFAYALAIAVGGMLIVILFIDSIGVSQQRYPQVWAGLITFVLIIALILAGRDKKGDGGHH
jgi:hypothetical protein